MNWQQICETPFFKDIPYKVETNKWGKIQMSPSSNEHGLYQALIIKWLANLADKGRLFQSVVFKQMMVSKLQMQRGEVINSLEKIDVIIPTWNLLKSL